MAIIAVIVAFVLPCDTFVMGLWLKIGTSLTTIVGGSSERSLPCPATQRIIPASKMGKKGVTSCKLLVALITKHGGWRRLRQNVGVGERNKGLLRLRKGRKQETFWRCNGKENPCKLNK